MSRCFSIPLLLLSFLAASPQAPPASDWWTSLRGKIVSLRTPARAKKLVFATDGTPRSSFVSGAWPSDSAFRVDKVNHSHNAVELQCSRLTLFLDPSGARKAIPNGNKLRIVLEAPPSATTLERVFLTSGQSPADVIPPDEPTLRAKYIQEVGRINEPIVLTKLPSGAPVYLVAGGVIPPRAIRTPEPEYPDGLRRSAQSGSAALAIIVDDAGKVVSIQVVKSDDPGFHLAAVEAVADWEFQPGTLNGKPVATALRVEVNFRLY